MQPLPAVVLAVALVALAPRAASAEILIKIDKSTQRMTVLRDREALYNWPVSTGATGYATPSGSFTAFRMEADHFSKEWDDAPMPYSIFFTQNGMAVHGTYDTKHLGLPVSHGCVRISAAHAATLFNLVRQDGLLTTKVVLTGSEQVALAAQHEAKRAQASALDVDPVRQPRPPVAAAQSDERLAQPFVVDRYRYDPAQSRDDPRYGRPPPLDIRPSYARTLPPAYDSRDDDDDDEN